MAYAKPTVGQFMSLRDDAIAKGVTREQVQNGGATLSLALDALKTRGRIKVLPAIQHPPWSNVVFVDDVPVQLDREWEAAGNEAGPDTPSDYVVRRVGHLYPPIGSGIVCANFVLVPLAGASFQQALDWAAQNKLPYASPRHVFALAKHKPNLHQELLKMDPASVFSPSEAMFDGWARVCYVWFGGSVLRRAGSDWIRCIDSATVWVAFLRE